MACTLSAPLSQDFLRSKGIEPTADLGKMTVKQTVNAMTKFLGTRVWDIAADSGPTLMPSHHSFLLVFQPPHRN